MRIEDWFPYEQINSSNSNFVLEVFDGKIPTELSDLDFLFEQFSLRMVRDSHPHIKLLLVKGAEACSEVFEDIDVKKGAKFFRRGSLFYLGILSWVSCIGRVPFEEYVFFDICDTDPRKLVWSANETLDEDIPKFRTLLDDVAPALEVTNPIENHLVVAGAGLVHLIVKNSILYEEERDFVEQLPDLASLEQRFIEIENE